jgi:c(7)-type cytochrome triheme protein
MTCTACHPALFETKAGATSTGGAAAFHEEKCGSCHDGKKAFDVNDGESCQRCHLTEGGAP